MTDPVNMRPLRLAKGDAAKPNDWRVGLLKNDKKQPKRGLANTLHVLSLHPSWQGVLAYDEFAECIVTLKAPPVRPQDAIDAPETGEWTEQRTARTAAWVATEAEFEPTTTMVEQAVAAIAEKTKIHPVRDRLRGLVWDGVLRVDRFLSTYFGAADTEYTRAVGPRWLISAVARVMEPGCQVDCMLVLEGKQGGGKSTGLEALFTPPLFADTGIHIGDKDSYQSLRRKWGYEFGELSSLKGREVERVKAFVSARSDNYRPSFGRRNRDFLRQVVFCGTTNDVEYLADRTGNRRFWPVRCSRVDVSALRRDRDQLWAEATARYDAGHRWHVDTAELRELCEAEQQDRQFTDGWVEIVARWLESPTVPDGSTSRRILAKEDGITTTEALLGALGMKPSDIRSGDTMRAGHCFCELNWIRRQVREGGRRVWRYFEPSHDEAESSPPSPDGSSGGGDANPASNVPDSPLSPVSPPDVHIHIRTDGDVSQDRTVKVDGDGGDTVTPGDCEDVEREAIQAEGWGGGIW